MATIDVWIQIEHHPWDLCPRLPIDRATAEGALPTLKRQTTLWRSPVTGQVREHNVNLPVEGEALILRRYTENWGRPDDRKVNPWDLNEPDPTDEGTMGTIPGPTIACDVGDTVRVHFRNLDLRREGFAAPWQDPASLPLLPVELRTHSLHTHGFTFPSRFDGAYPLTPADPDQPIEAAERATWDSVGVRGPHKHGDRVPPLGTFTYNWRAAGAASAGVWIYHDHSIADMESTSRGAIGFVVISNPADTEGEVTITPERLPAGSWTGSPVDGHTTPRWANPLGAVPYRRDLFDDPEEAPAGALPFHVQVEGTAWKLAFDVYRTPPDQALYLLLFHEFAGRGMCINGRKYLGNAPTLVAGPKTRMRFGVAGMGDAFHTFHVHGHRWVRRGPSGKTSATIEKSVQAEPVGAFEDVVTFGPGVSFAFTLEEGKGLLRADPPHGEWHLHCHVPHHMMEGMVGSLLVVDGGELAMPLPIGRGVPHPHEETAPHEPRVRVHRVEIKSRDFSPSHLTIGTKEWVEWVNVDREPHTVRAWNDEFVSGVIQPGRTFLHPFYKPGIFKYDCTEHTHYHPWAKDPAFHAPTIEVRAGGGSAPAPPSGGAASKTHDVKIGSGGFEPDFLSVRKGDTVRWTNNDAVVHNVTNDSHGWSSPTLATGQTWARTFTDSGTLEYHCHFHHEMTAKLLVTP